MKLIIGGAFQGKKEYAKQQFSLQEDQMRDGKEADFEELFRVPCLYHFHEWIQKGLKLGWDFDGITERLLQENPELILISNELGYGAVPMESFDRTYRETTGRICTKIAAESQMVIRVVCGMGMVIKNA